MGLADIYFNMVSPPNSATLCEPVEPFSFQLASSEIPLLLSVSHFVLLSLVHSAIVYCHKPPNSFPLWILVIMSASYYLLLSLLREAKILVLSPQLLLVFSCPSPFLTYSGFPVFFF